MKKATTSKPQAPPAKSAGQLLYDQLPSRLTRWEKLSKPAQALYEARAASKP